MEFTEVISCLRISEVNGLSGMFKKLEQKASYRKLESCHTKSVKKEKNRRNFKDDRDFST